MRKEKQEYNPNKTKLLCSGVGDWKFWIELCFSSMSRFWSSNILWFPSYYFTTAGKKDVCTIMPSAPLKLDLVMVFNTLIKFHSNYHNLFYMQPIVYWVPEKDTSIFSWCLPQFILYCVHISGRNETTWIYSPYRLNLLKFKIVSSSYMWYCSSYDSIKSPNACMYLLNMKDDNMSLVELHRGRDWWKCAIISEYNLLNRTEIRQNPGYSLHLRSTI